MSDKRVVLYALSTCPVCKKTLRVLDELGVAYEKIFVDLLSGQEQELILQEVLRHNPDNTYPTLVVGSTVIVGYYPDKIRELFK